MPKQQSQKLNFKGIFAAIKEWWFTF
jgi:hypothetical protein